MFTVPEVLGRQTPSNIAAEPAWKLRQWRLLKDSGTPEGEWEGGNQKF